MSWLTLVRWTRATASASSARSVGRRTVVCFGMMSCYRDSRRSRRGRDGAGEKRRRDQRRPPGVHGQRPRGGAASPQRPRLQPAGSNVAAPSAAATTSSPDRPSRSYDILVPGSVSDSRMCHNQSKGRPTSWDRIVGSRTACIACARRCRSSFAVAADTPAARLTAGLGALSRLPVMHDGRCGRRFDRTAGLAR